MSDQPRNWMTAEEFLAQVVVYRQLRLKEPLKARKPFVPGPFVRTYVLDRNHHFPPKPEAVNPLETEVTP
jgi:hypothetical protein